MSYEDLIPVLAPDLAGNPGWDVAIEMAEEEVNPGHCFYDRVVVLTAAHILTIAGRSSGPGGPVKSLSEGGLSMTFGDSGGGSSPMSSTGYGTEVQRLNALCYGMSARTAWINESTVPSPVIPTSPEVWPDKPIRVGNGTT